ncbi:GNAT family N-acetyltransferase [Lactococcus lactis]|nr:GNAT family N-acetyltransferase [Lactococcus lactis]
MTAQEARGKGVATTLINFFIDFAKKKDSKNYNSSDGFKSSSLETL